MDTMWIRNACANHFSLSLEEKLENKNNMNISNKIYELQTCPEQKVAALGGEDGYFIKNMLMKPRKQVMTFFNWK